MSRIDDIRERHQNASGERGWYIMHGTEICYEDPPGSCEENLICIVSDVDDAEFVGNAKKDIEYLLSILDQQRESLEQIHEELNGITFWGDMDYLHESITEVRKLVNVALQGKE